MVIKCLIFLMLFINSCKSKIDIVKQENVESKSNIVIIKKESKRVSDTLNLKIPKEIETPKILFTLFDEIEKTLTIDFSGDGIDDYLCYAKKETEYGRVLIENWVDSSLKVLRKKEVFLEYDYKWFIDLDNDNIPEVIKAQGESEGIDYGIYKLDFSSLNDTVLFYFNPVIEYENNFYWGYPWEIKDLLLKDNSLKFTLSHSIIRDGEITRPKWQKRFPVLIFKGKNKEEVNNLKGIRVFQIEDIKNIQFIKIEDIKNLVI